MFGNEFTKSESTFHYTHLRKARAQRETNRIFLLITGTYAKVIVRKKRREITCQVIGERAEDFLFGKYSGMGNNDVKMSALAFSAIMGHGTVCGVRTCVSQEDSIESTCETKSAKETSKQAKSHIDVMTLFCVRLENIQQDIQGDNVMGRSEKCPCRRDATPAATRRTLVNKSASESLSITWE